ncbi:MAG: hypothetical protein E7157_00490 [Lactobacillales bacterium]|nr:hypothetical protein [Lactobacillales bacterium]
MNREQLVEYVNLYNQFQKNPNMQFTAEQLNLINEVHKEAQTNQELATFLSNTSNSTEQERMNALNEYINKQEIQKQGEKEEEVIAATYGIDISNIQHKYLDNGKEIFYFYDMKLGRNVVLENKKEGISLVEQLKQMQIENEKFQLGTNEQNTNQMLNEQQNKENIEIKMIPLNEIENHMNQLQNMSVEDAQKFNFLVRNAEQMGISYINIENLIGINQSGELLEVKYDKLNNKYEISSPTGAIYHENEITTSDRIDNSYTESEQYNNLQSNFEDKPEIETVDEFDQLSDEMKEQIQKYHEYPELLEMLPEEEKQMWTYYVDIYEQKLEKEQEMQNQQNKPKQYVYKKQDKKAGFADILLLSLITGFLGGILTTLTTILLTK